MALGKDSPASEYVTLLSTDDGEKPNATSQDVEAAIRQLDGVTWTIVLVEDPSGRTLSIGGGPQRFVAEVAEDAKHRFAIVDQTRGGGRIDLVIGGQLVDYPARVCVALDAVLSAARVFTEQAGARDPALTWSVEA